MNNVPDAAATDSIREKVPVRADNRWSEKRRELLSSVDMKRVAPVVILVFALIAGAGLRTLSVANKQVPSFNESISYSAASCKQGQWEVISAKRAAPYGTWTKAASWQQLWHPDRAFCFSQIAHDLNESDIHPPLYFWLLHVWVLVFGVSLTSGLTLNLLLATLTGLTLFALGRRVLGNSLLAALVVVIWTTSPAVVSISSQARQYDLLTLVTALLVLQTFRWIDMKRDATPTQWALLSLITAAGIITQYIFVMVVAAVCIVLFVSLVRKNIRRLALGYAAIGTGLLSLFVLNPGFMEALHNEGTRNIGFTLERLGERVNTVLATMTDFVVGKGINTGNLLYIVPATLGIIFVAWLAAWTTQQIRARRTNTEVPTTPAGGRIGFLAAWFGLVVIMLYFTFLTPRNAMGASYLASAWLFVAFLPAIGAAILGAARTPMIAVVAVAMVGLGSANAIRVNSATQKPPSAVTLTQPGDMLLVDTVHRGLLPPILWNVHPAQPVFIADQDMIIRNKSRWASGLESRVIYVSAVERNRGFGKRMAILSRLNRRFDHVDQKGAITRWHSEHIGGIEDPVFIARN